MTRILRTSFGVALGFMLAAGMAAAQQAPQASTPGVTPGTTGTTFGTPGAQQMPDTPGGTIQQGASTQDQSVLPRGVRNFNNSSDSSPYGNGTTSSSKRR